MDRIFPSGEQSRDVSGDLAIQHKSRVAIHRELHNEVGGKLGGSSGPLLFSAATGKVNLDPLFEKFSPDVIVDGLQREVMSQQKVTVEVARRVVFDEILTSKQRFIYLGFDAQTAEAHAAVYDAKKARG